MVTRFLRPYQIDHLISDLEMTTYKRELERYGPKTIDLAESIFYYDSEMVLGLTSLFRKNRDEDKRDLYCIKAIHGYFVAFNMILEERLIIVKNLSESFLKEFNADGAMKKQLGIKFRSMKDGIKDCLESNSVEYDSIIEKRNERVTELLGSLSDEHKEAIRFRLPSYIHMTVNRMIPASPRMHELVLYSYLEKYYRILYYQEKQERSVQTS